MNVITNTLNSGNYLTITPSFDSGEIVIAGLLCVLLAILVIRVMYGTFRADN